MPDISEKMLSRIKEYRLPNLDFGDGFVYPNYEANSILNIPGSLAQLLGAPGFGAAPLAANILDPLGENIRQVIFILMDALALHRFQQWCAEDHAPIWEKLINDGVFSALTSVTPSTTSAALTTLWTGRPPVWHGISGYEMWLKEYGIVANMIEQKPIAFSGASGSLESAGFSPEAFLPSKNNEALTLGSHLKSHGIQTHAFQQAIIANSGLSRMFFADTNLHPFTTLSDLWVSVLQLLESNQEERLYAWVYWGAVDELSHHHGPEDERTIAEFSHFSAAFENQFLERLSPAARKDTLIILSADHGQIATRIDSHYDLNNHPDFLRRLHIYPTGENRLAYLHIRPGQIEAIKEYIERTWPNQFVVIESDYAVHNGLFGPGDPHSEFGNRTGDLILIARGDAYLWWGSQEDHLLGRHGGLSPEEMLVPFLAARLG